jgi:glutathione S-transferase
MYTLYYTTRSYTSEPTSMIPHVALEEIGAPYENVEVELEPSPPDWYLQLNPHGKVPSLVDRGEAEVGETIVYPSAAILFYLADRHPATALAPEPGTAARGMCYQRVFDMAEMLQVGHMLDAYPERFCTDSADGPAIKAKAAEWIAQYWGEIDSTLAEAPYLLGEVFSLSDIYMYVIARWNRPPQTPIKEFPNVVRTCGLIERRPAVQRVLQANEINPIAS